MDEWDFNNTQINSYLTNYKKKTMVSLKYMKF